MHPYSIDTDERKKVSLFISSFTILFTWIIYSGLKKAGVAIPWWIDAPSILGFYGIFYWLFNAYVWRWPLLRKIGLIKTPILSGKWRGRIDSSFGTTKEVTVRIKQTWDSMRILLKTNESESHSTTASLNILAPEGPMLSYQYQNDPSHAAPQTMNIHYGTAQLLIEDEKKMSGKYYSGRGRQNVGSLALTKL